MPTASHLRAQIEATLAERIPSALTPLARVPYPVAPTGIPEIDLLLHGGFPVGALSEMVGPECSGRTSLALAFVAGMTQAGKVCAWVDVSDTLHPESAAAIGVDLSRLLWVRCGSSPVTAPLPHAQCADRTRQKNRPRQSRGCQPQVGAIRGWRPKAFLPQSAICSVRSVAPRCAEALHKPRPQGKQQIMVRSPQSFLLLPSKQLPGVSRGRGWNRHYGLPIYCCRRVASAASCWIWAA